MRLKLCLTVGCQNQLVEQFRVEETWICLSGLGAVANVIRKTWNGDFLSDLETHLEVFRNLFQVVAELIHRWWSIEGGIVPDGAKEWLAVMEILAILA